MCLLNAHIQGPILRDSDSTALGKCTLTALPTPSGALNAGGEWISPSVWDRIYSLEAESLPAGVAWSELFNLSLSFLLLKRGGDTFSGLF